MRWTNHRGRWAAATLASVVATGVAAQTAVVPLPPPRPGRLAPVAEPPLPPSRPATLAPVARPVFGPPMPPSAPPAAVAAPGPAPEDEAACRRLLEGGKVLARALPPIPPSQEGCGLPTPVAVSAVLLPGGRRIAVEPAATVDCPLAEAVADWVRDDLVPLFTAPAAPLAALTGTGGYECRGRNGVAGARLSEHARGNALDVAALRTADGRSHPVKDADIALIEKVKATACARFATVLGPGSDGFHETHMHVDLALRKHGGKLCQWSVPTPPAPSWNAGRRGPL